MQGGESVNEEKRPSTMRSLERAIDVLEVLERSGTPLRLSEVAREADLHVATTQRILTVLEGRGRVEHDASGYRTGVAMLFGAHAYLTTSRVALAAPVILQQLADATGLTSSVFVRAGISRAAVARVEGTDPLRYVLPLGERLPLYLGAGKALAAYLEPSELDEVFKGKDAFTRADGTTVTLGDFHRELEAVRATGWTLSRDERVIGTTAVAAPVLSPSGACLAAVQVAGPSHSQTFEDTTSLGYEVRNAAAALAARLG
ncbi:hypothetical protein BH708_16145 [Brachybacterium sp. P6-10-X1]|uniref:IclR family transcriptional regulator n=1 Tax=Brachybacterium sp. P6-10-X1 TaxID=1903186 RepID=UPI0009718D81|nr:IclR family transcriptional regulator [Brachybacterium sp. P6-10-X1]APX33987.1 hypothetical protein BH708_16145 [Brachybacterium sp. P6-10-X1]